MRNLLRGLLMVGITVAIAFVIVAGVGAFASYIQTASGAVPQLTQVSPTPDPHP